MVVGRPVYMTCDCGLEYCDLDILFIVLHYIDSNRVLINITAKRIRSPVKYNWVFLNTIFSSSTLLGKL